MSDVTFIGLGLMGTALARAAVRGGYDVTVWNRTAAKADALVEEGATYLEDVAQAVSQSPIIIVCVFGYDVSDSILRTPDVEAALKGRTLVQLTNGSTRLAKEAGEWASRIGIKYVDGGIEGFPDKIGQEDSMFMVSGDREGFEAAEQVLRTLAPILHYLGDDAAQSSAMYSAMLAGSFGHIFGVMNAVAICEAMDISLKKYLEIMVPVFKNDVDMLVEMVEKCDEDKLDETDAYLSVWNETLGPIIEALKDSGCNAEFPELMHDILRRAEKAGYAKHDLAALINMIRPKKA